MQLYETSAYVGYLDTHTTDTHAYNIQYIHTYMCAHTHTYTATNVLRSKICWHEQLEKELDSETGEKIQNKSGRK